MHTYFMPDYDSKTCHWFMKTMHDLKEQQERLASLERGQAQHDIVGNTYSALCRACEYLMSEKQQEALYEIMHSQGFWLDEE